jgi:hypothetical protein
MTTQLRDALDDLVTEVAPHVAPADLGPRAWLAGRRRRVRRRLTRGLLVAAAAILAVAVTPVVGDLRSLHSPADADDRGVGGYPQRIGHQWWIRTLPDRPGPVAALVEAGPDDGPILWYAVTETGHRWRLPAPLTGNDIYPAVSRDGRRIGYLLGDRGPYVIHDLVAGTRTEFAGIGSNLWPIVTAYYVAGQFPSFWSPDGRRVAQGAGSRDDSGSGGAVVLNVDGSVTFVPGGEGDAGKGHLAGWVGSDALLWVKFPPFGEITSGATVVATVTGLDGQPRRTITLSPSSPWQGNFAGQWTGTASPDGRELLIIEDTPAGPTVRRFSLLDGRETADPASLPTLGMCAAGWAGSTPTVPIYDEVTAATAVVHDGELRTVVAVEPSVGARCFIWAGEALSGEAHGGLLGTSTAWWTWWMREMAAALALAGAGVWAVRRWRRSRRHVTADRGPIDR